MFGAPKAPLLERALRRPFAFTGLHMRRIAVFVDAGYFWVQATHIVHGKRCGRDDILVDYPILRESLLEQVGTQFLNAELLRVYWYDGPGSGGKTSDHRSIEDLDDFKLRLGTRNGAGNQKAVDGLIIADIIGLAQAKAISEALLVTGDADLTPGVMAAQNLGIRVHLLSLGPIAATSPFLKAEVDRKTHWNDAEVRKFVTATAKTVTTTPAAPIMEPGIVPEAPHEVMAVAAPISKAVLLDSDTIATLTFETLTPELRMAVPKKGALPSEVDRSLLARGRNVFGRPLEEMEKRALRDALRHRADLGKIS